MVLFLCFISGNTSFAQQISDEERYENVIDAPNDTIRINRLCHNFNLALLKREMSVSEQCFGEALLLIEKTKYEVGINNLKRIIENNLSKKGNYKRALELSFKLKEVSDKIGYLKGASDLLGDIGVLYWRQGDSPNALYFFNEDLKLLQKTKIKQDIASVYNNIGLVYRQSNNLDEALRYYTRALQLYTESNSKEGLSDIYNNIGVVHQIKEDYNKASYFFDKSLQLCYRQKDSIGISIALGNLGVISFKLNNTAQAEKYYLQAFGISQRHDDLEGVKEVGEALSELYSFLNKGDQALKYYKLFIQARDTLNNAAFRREALIKEMEFKFDKEEEKKNIMVEADKKRQQLYTISVAVILILVLIFSALLYKRFALTKKQKTIIESQKQLVEEKQKEITDSIHYAKRIQSTLLAHQALLQKNLPEHFVLFKPKDIVSGDFYWATKKDEKFYLAVCDSTGHGVPGAFMSLLNISFLNEAINEKQIGNSGEVFNYVRKRLIENVSQEGGRDGMDGVLLTINAKTKKISYAAANNVPVLIRNGNSVELKGDKMPVGQGEKMTEFSEYNYAYEQNDILYLYTDGFADQFGGPKGKKFKYNQLNNFLIAIHNKPLTEQHAMLTAKFEEWKGSLEQVDDVCLIGIRLS